MDCDFLIIGGGVAGVTLGAALSEMGTVHLWEAEPRLGHHASARSAALFEEAYGSAPVVALNRASRAAHEAHGDLAPRGLMLVGLAGEEAGFARDLAGMALEAVAVEAARETVPLSEAVTRVGWHADAFDLDTNAMQERAARAIRAAGGTVETGRPVDALAPVAGGWRAGSGGHSVTARMVFDAAGAWADGVAALAGLRPLGLDPRRRSIARLRAADGTDVSGWPMLLGVGESWYAKPDAGALIVSPADETPSAPMDAWPEDIDLALGIERAGRAVPLPGTRPLATWAGLRTFSPDRVPVLGPSEAPGFWWYAGQGGYGFQTAPAAAALVADLVAGRPPALDAATVAALSPARFG